MQEIIQSIPYSDTFIVAVMAYKFIAFLATVGLAMRIAWIAGPLRKVYVLFALGFSCFLFTFYQSFDLLPLVFKTFREAPRDAVLENQVALLFGCTFIFSGMLIKYLMLRKSKLI